jgi:hypothetical protein
MSKWSREEEVIRSNIRQGGGESAYSTKQAGISLNCYLKLMKGSVMKRLLLLSACLVFVGIAIAEEKPVNLLKTMQPGNFEFGPDAYYYRYREPDMKQTGYFYGVQAAYTYRNWLPAYYSGDNSDIKLMVRMEARLDWGVVDYDGELVNTETDETTPYKFDNKHDSIGEFRLLIGPDFPKADVVDTIYSGIGYRYLNDDESGDPFGYDRRSNYLYWPIGFKTLRNLSGKWLLSANAEFDLLLHGSQSSDLSDFGYGTVHNKQNSGYGVRGAVGFEYTTKEVAVIIQPFIRYWDIDESEVDNGFVEPKNNTTEIGLDLVFRF